MRDFSKKLDQFARAVEQQDGAAFGALFTENAVYHDAIYGAVRGREAIAKMMQVDWYKDGDVWLWDMIDPVCDEKQGYVRYVASFRSINRFSQGNRVVAPGVGMFTFKDGLFDTYHEIANGTPALWDLNVRGERLQNVVQRIALWDLNVRGERLQNVVQRIADAQRASPSLADHYRGERS